MRNKLELTRALLTQLPTGHAYTAEDVIPIWWVNIRNTGGLRLTGLGYQTLKLMDIESWTVDLDPSKFDRNLILLLDRKLQAPYYIEIEKKLARRLIMFSSREAMMATLYGDLKTFLKQLP
jgi:hypothetical protein